MSKKPIQLVACTIRPESCLRNLSFMQLSFPDEWFEPLQALQEERSDRLGQPTTIPIRSLNAVLQALIPYLLAAPNAVRRSREEGLKRNLIADCANVSHGSSFVKQFLWIASGISFKHGSKKRMANVKVFQQWNTSSATGCVLYSGSL